MPRPLATIGVVAGDRAYQFHEVSDAAVQSDGDIVVVDAGYGSVRLFSPEGELKRTLGSAGSGPGEFRRPTGVAIGSADSVFIWDAGAWRLTRFGADGELAVVQTISPTRMEELSAPPLYPESAVPLQDGALLVRLGEKPVGKSGSSKEVPTPTSRTDAFRRRAAAVRATPAAGIAQLVATFPGEEQVFVQSPWGELQVAPVLAKNTAIATQPNGTRICLGDQETPELRCFADDGSRTVIRWSSVPVAVDPTGARVTSWREAVTETYGQKLDRDAARRLIEQIPIPAILPPFTSIHIDKTGHIWVDTGPSNGSNADSADFLVFAPDGILLGSVAVPEGRVLEIGDDYILAVREDDLDVQYVERYRLVKPALQREQSPHDSGQRMSR